MRSIRALASFPAVVNEKAARVVAAVVALLAALGAMTAWRWVPVVLAVGFLLRVLAGPRLSPLGRLAAGVIAPRLGAPTFVPGAPKRFAQGIGLALTTVASVAAWSGSTPLAGALLGLLVVFASLEAVVGFCAGCALFAGLIRLGLVPERICLECADITRRQRPAAAEARVVSGSGGR
jgi:hypothetical protein